ncbi:hypothetical protein [Agrobacterium cavarae]
MILDPYNITDDQITGEIQGGDITKLTKKQRKLGFLPNINNIRPGDLILTQPSKLAWRAMAIQLGQKLQKSDESNKWTHAATYVGEWRVVEATPQEDVSSGTLLSWVPCKKILVRRPKIFETESLETARHLGMQIALEAALKQGIATYGTKSFPSVISRLIPKNRNKVKNNLPPEHMNESLICSTLYAECYTLALGPDIRPNKDMRRTQEPVSPSLLAGLSSLVDVKVGWARIV